MEGDAARSPSARGKRVSFGPVTVIPIPRRGKLSLSSSTLDTEGEEDSPLVHGGADLLKVASELASEKAPPLAAAPQPSPLPATAAEVSPQALPLTDSQVTYLQRELFSDSLTNNSDGDNHPTGTNAPGRERETPEEDEEIVRSPVPPSLWRRHAHRSRTVSLDESDRSPLTSPSTLVDPPGDDSVVPSSLPSFSSSPPWGSARESSTQRFAAALGELLGPSPSAETQDRRQSPPDTLPTHPAIGESPSPSSSSSCGAATHDNTPLLHHSDSGTVVSAARAGPVRAATSPHLGDEPPLVARRLELGGGEAHTVSPATAASREEQCVFCGLAAKHEGNSSTRKAPAPQASAPGALSDEEEATAACPPGFTRQDGLLFHTACALWCPEVFYDPSTKRLQNVSEAVARSKHIKCALCRREGAGLGCACSDCQLSFHLPCAIRQRKRNGPNLKHSGGGGGGVTLDTKGFSLWCPVHKPPSNTPACYFST